MGGPGSGRWGAHTRRRTVGELQALAVGGFRDALREADARWWAMGAPARSVLLRDVSAGAGRAWWLEPPGVDGARALRLTPAVRDAARGTVRATGAPLARLRVEAVPVTLGGARWWFRCPGCDRRCGAVYRGPFDWAPTFAGARCRRCLGLGYGVQRLDPVGRARRRLQRAHARLGVRAPWMLDDDALSTVPPRPWGMHAARYARLVADLEAACVEWDTLECLAMVAQASVILGPFAKPLPPRLVADPAFAALLQRAGESTRRALVRGGVLDAGALLAAAGG